MGELLLHCTGEGVLNDFAKGFNLLFVDKEREVSVCLICEISRKVATLFHA